MTHDRDRAEGDGRHRGHVERSHGVSPDSDRGKLAITLGLIVTFMAFEVAAGVIAGSLALLSDAAHMLTDAAAIALSLLALRLGAKPARGKMTFGFKRAEILSAQFNGATLLVLALLIVYEAVRRLMSPPPVQGTAVLIVALAGIVVNLASTYLLSTANRESMNIEGAFKHIVTDLVAFISTAIAGALILATGFRRADPIASLLIAVIMLYAAVGLLRDSGRVFLEAAPEGVDPDTIGRAMAAQPGVCEVHDLHVWESPPGFLPCRPMSSSARRTTAMGRARRSSDCRLRSSRSSTPPFRSTTSKFRRDARPVRTKVWSARHDARRDSTRGGHVHPPAVGALSRPELGSPSAL